MTKTIAVTINGESREMAAGLTMQDMLQQLGLDPATVVVERNAEIFAREQLALTLVGPGDRLEIVHFMGGG